MSKNERGLDAAPGAGSAEVVAVVSEVALAVLEGGVDPNVVGHVVGVVAPGCTGAEARHRRGARFLDFEQLRAAGELLEQAAGVAFGELAQAAGQSLDRTQITK